MKGTATEVEGDRDAHAYAVVLKSAYLCVCKKLLADLVIHLVSSEVEKVHFDGIFPLFDSTCEAQST